MNTRIPIFAAMCLVTGLALAQPAMRHGAPNAAERMERLTILLDLNDGQKVEVAKVLEEQREQMRAVRKQIKDSDELPTREQLHAQHEQARQETIDKLRPILTDQQLKKFEVLNEGPRVRLHRMEKPGR